MQKHRPESVSQTNGLRSGIGNQSLILCVAVVAVAGIAAGYLFAPPETEHSIKSGDIRTNVDSQQKASNAVLTDIRVHHFALSEADIGDSIEAPALTVLDSGKIALAWATTISPQERQVILVTSTDDGETFSPPASVVTTGIHTSVSKMRGREVKRQMRTLPHLEANGETLVLCWVDGGEARESVVLRLAESVDAGQSFSAPIAVHQSLDARPTFTSMHISEDGTIACSWLDNRNKVQQPFASVQRPGQAEFEPEKMVYAGPDGRGICPCCPTAAFVSDGEVRVTFRGNEGGFRDMWTAHLPNDASSFAAPAPNVEPTWEFSGCPHDGPTMCETSDGLHVAWMDGHTGVERIYVSSRELTERPTAIGDLMITNGSQTTISQGHPQLAAYRNILYLVWDQSLPISVRHDVESSQIAAVDDSAATGGGKRHSHHANSDGASGGRAIYLAKSMDGGKTFTSPIALAPIAAHFQTRPRIEISNDGKAVVAWMDLSESGKTIVVATLPEVDSDELFQLSGGGQ